MNQATVVPIPWLEESADYSIDTFQRTVLYADTIRRRGNDWLRHNAEGMPPVLVFPWEMVVDGRRFRRPVNYALVRILDRRSPAASPEGAEGRRKMPQGGSRSRPIVIIDPRAGHGPGIGGTKRDSEIGMAIQAGHPVYFVIFFPEPEPGQTLTDIRDAEVRFLEVVAERHPEAGKPAVIGNCQGGWAAALVGATRPDLVGPMVFNGSPLSYWGGVAGANPMRYRGGLFGGVWLTSLANDLGNGRFDGAHLVAGFEDLNPANTWWSKQYHLYAQIDREERRYLDFERWWGGFYLMNADEIHFIVDSLFIGNRLERGELELEEGVRIHLQRITEPIVVFASHGDNITPPQQALNWIVKVYGSVEEIRRNGQVIVYILHHRIGHLGIFASAKVARKEHKEIIGSFEMLDYLAPGLYEMIIVEEPVGPDRFDYTVRFVERDMDDILALDDGLEDEAAFVPVDAASRWNDRFYRSVFSPWVSAATNEVTAEWLRQMHPLRVSRWFFSDLNPCMLPLEAAASRARTHRRPAGEDNPWVRLERDASRLIVQGLNLYRDLRDAAHENLFRLCFGTPWMHWWFSTAGQTTAEPVHPALEAISEEKLSGSIDDFVAGVVRLLLALMTADGVVERAEYDRVEQIVRSHPRLKGIPPDTLRQTIRQEAARLQTATESAIAELAVLFRDAGERGEAVDIARRFISRRGRRPRSSELAVYRALRSALD
ncbi:MAG: DUF3141 domain-containing protein [Desulfobacteraceae bacterium]|nr:DUF3141 domain-containing protein [Desulfobacteraceae bacterium]